MSYEVYKRGVIDAAMQALKEYGCTGYNKNWSDSNSAFFIGELLAIMGVESKICSDVNYRSSITEELNMLLNAYDKH